MGKTNINAHVQSIERSLHLIYKNLFSIGQLHDDVILLQLPESLCVLFSCAN